MTSNPALLTIATATKLATPGAPTASAVSGSTTSITVSYTPVTNAASHTLRVYAAGVLIGSPRTSFASGSTITGLSAATTYTLTLTAISTTDEYLDSDESSAGSITTNAAATPATISSHPVSATKYAGQSVTFTVSASVTDAGTLSYQWKKNGTAISGATSASYTIASVTSTDGASYTVTITNSLNATTASVTSNPANLIVNNTNNVITFQALTNKAYGDIFDVAVSASSGLKVTLVSTTTSVCTISNISVTAIAVGTCTITASQAGNATYPAAISVSRSLTVNKKDLIITASSQNIKVGDSLSAASYTQTGLVTSRRDSIRSVTYTYKGTGSTRYVESAARPVQDGNWILGTYAITPQTIAFSSGLQSNYSISFVPGNLIVTGTSEKRISSISVKSTGVNKNTELLTGFIASQREYSFSVATQVSSIASAITREAGSLVTAQVSVNDSGFRKVSFTSNKADSGPLALNMGTNIVTIRITATDLSSQDYVISILRDQESTPIASALTSAKFFVNAATNNDSGMIEVSMTPSFLTSTKSYTLNVANVNSATQLRIQYLGAGLTVRVKVNQSAFKTMPATGISASLPLIVGSNVVILRISSSDGTFVDYGFTVIRAGK